MLSQTCQTSPARTTGLWHPGTAHPCLPTNSTSWRAGKGRNCEGNRTSSFPVPPCCSQNTKLSHRQLVKPGCATSMCHQKHGHRTGPRVHTQRPSTAYKEQHRPWSHCQNSTAWHHHARQRMSVCWRSHWAEASGAVTAPYTRPQGPVS